MNEVMNAATPEVRSRLNELDAAIKELPQVDIHTEHLFHAGMYIRTIKVPAGTLLTNVHIIIPTTLFISGHCLIYDDEEWTEYKGYSIVMGRPGRQNAFYTIEDTYLTMTFASDARSVKEAEEEFTDEPWRLGSRKEG